MHSITLKYYMHIPITRRIRSVVDESLVHCQFEFRHRTLFFFVFFFDFIFYQFIYLFKDIIHNHFHRYNS